MARKSRVGQGLFRQARAEGRAYFGPRTQYCRGVIKQFGVHDSREAPGDAQSNGGNGTFDQLFVFSTPSRRAGGPC
jgi:hypothetical protein